MKELCHVIFVYSENVIIFLLRFCYVIQKYQVALFLQDPKNLSEQVKNLISTSLI